jgi:hypothetical protein
VTQAGGDYGMMKHGYKADYRLYHIAEVNVFNDDEISGYKRDAILDVIGCIARSFREETGLMPTTCVVAYDDFRAIDHAMSKLEGKCIPDDEMHIFVDRERIAVKRGCDTKPGHITLMSWEED